VNLTNEEVVLKTVEMYNPLSKFKQCALSFLKITPTRVSEVTLRKLTKWSKTAPEPTKQYNFKKTLDLWSAIQVFCPYINEKLITRFSKISISKVDFSESQRHTHIQYFCLKAASLSLPKHQTFPSSF
jgi:hypothetical protein